MANEDGELDSSNQEMFLGSNVGDIPSSGSMNSFYDEIFNDVHACTHTHTRYHVHTKVIPAMSNDEDSPTAESLKRKSKKSPRGNGEAVRKYREKKKARAALLEDEVVRLKAMNQHLMKKIQSQAGLEAEVGRLKCLLVDIRGRIDGEIGCIPYQKQQPAYQSVVDPNLGGGFLLNPCNMQQGALMHHDLEVNDCETENMRCLRNHGSVLSEFPECGANNGLVGATLLLELKEKVLV